MKLDQTAPRDESTQDKIERYKQRFPAIVMNIFAAWLCLSALAWIIPAIGRSYWTQHPGGAAAYVWLGLVVIGVMWNLYAIGSAVRCAIDLCPYCKIAEQTIQTFDRSEALRPSSTMNEKCHLISIS